MKRNLNIYKDNQHDNLKAHLLVKKLMEEGEKLTFQFFYDDLTQANCVWIISEHIRTFKYMVCQESYDWILNYLVKGKSDDSNVDSIKIKEGEEGDKHIQTNVLMAFIEMKVIIQFTPLYKEQANLLTGVAQFPYGKIVFKAWRTQRIMDFLKDHDIVLS